MRSLLLALSSLLFIASALGSSQRRAQKPPRSTLVPRQAPGQLLQQNVTWDEYSFFINGKRVMLFSGEIHPYRNPVQSLHLDVFQKVKAMGFNAVSFYVFWGLHEPKRGEISFEGFRDLQPFIDAAKKAGIWLIARPGPYINAETTGGGFPGWGTYTPGLWRTSNSTYLDAYQLYMKSVSKIIADNEITKGGPVILYQSENEYTNWQAPYTEDFTYEKLLYQTIRDAGVTVPITTNDAWPGGHYTSVDIYGYDSYPHGFDCSNPTSWGKDSVPEYFWNNHIQFSPKVPNSVFEFQGGAFDGWGGAGYDACSILTGPEFERVFYKNEFAMSTTLLSLYMLFGGTSWGGIAHPGVYTSYDYGSAIAEDRTLREKFYELKLQAYFLAVSPAFLTTRPQNIYSTQGSFTGNSALKTTQTLDVVGKLTGFYVVRHADASSNAAQSYTLTLPTSLGSLKIPALGGSLTLAKKDSKIHVVDYLAGSTTLLYSTAEILTWTTVDKRDVIFLYGNAGELHETAFKFGSNTGTVIPTVKVLSPSSGTANPIKSQVINGGALAVQYKTIGQTVIQVGTTVVYILERGEAYKFWRLNVPSQGELGAFNTEHPIIVKGGYLVRSATVQQGITSLVGDLNATTSFEIIAPADDTRAGVLFNGVKLSTQASAWGSLLTSAKTVVLPSVTLPTLSSLPWKVADSLPEINPAYSDDKWTVANKVKTDSPFGLSTPTVLFAGEYGYHTGNIVWRAHFNATGSETGFQVKVTGGSAFGFSVWLGPTFIGSWVGDAVHSTYEGTFKFPQALKAGQSSVITIVQDHMGYEEDWWAASDSFKEPRGVRSYSFVNSPATKVSVWKVTGNLGGESYVDRTRGPLNEGGLYGERQGWHLPGFNDASWKSGSPLQGISAPGVSLYRTKFNLNIPKGVDYPLAIVLTNSTTNPHYRSQIYVNGYQFGKYINHIGPQKSFPVPQGILNFNGENTLAISLWAGDTGGAKLASLNLQHRAKIESSLPTIVNQPATAWAPRPNAY